MADIFGNITRDELYTYNPLSYNKYKDYSATNTPQQQNYGALISRLLSGQMSPEEQYQWKGQLESSIASANESSFGMPAGAAASLKQRTVADASNANILNRQNMGLQYGMPFINSQIGENQFGYSAGQNENQFGQNFNANQYGIKAGYDAKAMDTIANSGFNVSGLLSGAVGAATTFGLNALMPGAGAVSSLFGGSKGPTQWGGDLATDAFNQNKYSNPYGLSLFNR